MDLISPLSELRNFGASCLPSLSPCLLCIVHSSVFFLFFSHLSFFATCICPFLLSTFSHLSVHFISFPIHRSSTTFSLDPFPHHTPIWPSYPSCFPSSLRSSCYSFPSCYEFSLNWHTLQWQVKIFSLSPARPRASAAAIAREEKRWRPGVASAGR